MKKIHTFIVFFLCLNSFILEAQAPDLFNYQALLRDNTGTVLQNQNVSLRFSVLKTIINGVVVYSETFQTTTNNFGVVNLVIGTGTTTFGDFTTVDWAADSYYLKTEMDPTGGTNYTLLGTTQFVSVPYAKYASVAGIALGNLTEEVDGDTQNEIQTLSYADGILTLSQNGGSVAIVPVNNTIWATAPGTGGSSNPCQFVCPNNYTAAADSSGRVCRSFNGTYGTYVWRSDDGVYLCGSLQLAQCHCVRTD